MRKILAEGIIHARDQNKVFVERASARKLSPNDVVARYKIGPEKETHILSLTLRMSDWFRVTTRQSNGMSFLLLVMSISRTETLKHFSISEVSYAGKSQDGSRS
jgi:hypothetical protein